MAEPAINELKILEFQVNKELPNGNILEGCYGINVLKVQRIINMPDTVVQIPASHPAILGIITVQDISIPVIDLTQTLKRNVPTSLPSKVIITEFCGKLHGFAVHNVVRIHNIEWDHVEHPPEIVASDEVYTIGIVRLQERMALLLDFEKIVSDINPELGIKKEEFETPKPARTSKHILIADDSTFFRNSLRFTLARAGYNVEASSDGKEAFRKLEEYLDRSNSENKNINEFVNLIVADLEMPQMDGRELIECIKKNQYLQNLPIIIFSSLINQDYDSKAKELGVNAVIGKPKIKELLNIIDKILL